MHKTGLVQRLATLENAKILVKKEDERHALASAVGIDVHGQRGIEMKSQAAKKLPGKKAVPVNSKSLIARLHE